MKLRIIVIAVVVVLAALLLWFVKGRKQICDDEKIPFEKNEDEATTEEQDIRYVTKPRVEGNWSETKYNSLSNENLAWWFKRDANHGPSDCDHTIDISKYGAYYLDSRVASANTADAADKVIYLTLDCGYDNGLTEGMLDVLKRCDVPACFFVTQTYIRDNIALVKRMKEEGHQVGNHTIRHPVMTKLSNDEIKAELDGCYNYMKEATGYDMDPYFRPPSGEYSERVLAIAQDLGYKTIFWSMAYYDYDVNKQPGCDYVIEHFKKYHHNGAIILMHNVSTSNAEALETVINNLKAEGYRFASLNELE